jgi:hypothetical protein
LRAQKIEQDIHPQIWLRFMQDPFDTEPIKF